MLVDLESSDDYDETSCRLLITYPVDKLTIQGGAFQYANGTRWAVIRNELNNLGEMASDDQWSSFDAYDTHPLDKRQRRLSHRPVNFEFLSRGLGPLLTASKLD